MLIAMTLMISSKKNCSLPINYRWTLRDIGDNLGISPETVRALVKTKKLQKKRRNLKPRLMEVHKENCLNWICSFIQANGFYDNFYQHVHIDKNGLYLSKMATGITLRQMSLCLHAVCSTRNMLQK